MRRYYMAEKMSEGTRAVIVNAAIVAGLIWCYFREYSLEIIPISGLLLIVFANILMYLKRRNSKQPTTKS
jgi:hypothetical protein